MAQRAGVKSGVWFPLIVGGNVIGTMDFFALETLTPTSERLDVLRSVGRLVSSAIERLREAERQQETAANTSAVNQVLAEMGKAARKSAAQSEAQTCPSGQGRWPSVPFGMIGACHDTRMSSTGALPNGPCVLKKRYERTSVPDRNKYYADETAVPTY